jgi:hypothetical protein
VSVAASDVPLMLLFPLICLMLGAVMDFGLAVLLRRKMSLFPGGADRFYRAVMIAALIRSAVFSLVFVPAVAAEGQVMAAYPATQLEAAVLMVLPALFGAYFATRLERGVVAALESPLLRDRRRFLALKERVGSEAEQ